MGTLDGVGLDDLHAALEVVEGRKETLRVAVGIAYLHGVSATELAEWHGVSRATVYDWLARLERLTEEPPVEALEDADRPGRPPKLSSTKRDALSATLGDRPTEAGYEATAWTPALVERHVRSTYGVEYSRRHVRDLLYDLGLAPDTDGGWRPTG